MQEERRYPRVGASIPVDVRLDDEVGRLVARSVSVNVSRGGVLVRLGRTWPVGTRCLVRFLEASEWLSPETVMGTVRRDTRSGEGFVVAVEFDELLRTLKVTADLDA